MQILVIRRDNIGDLVCTTPMLHMLRQAYPDAWIGVLANRYNAEVLVGNPDIDEICAYQKAKHRPAGVSRWSVWFETLLLLWRLRQRRLDLVILASPGGHRFARWLGAQQVVDDKGEAGHEVERCVHLLSSLGIAGEPGPLFLAGPIPRLVPGSLPVVGLHLSARKPQQRWPAEAFAGLARRLLSEGAAGEIHLFWAPGAADDPLHPGDDDKMRQVLASLTGLAVTPVPTASLRQLIDGIAACDEFICSDGGAMHVAAGLGKPIVCLFGNSGPERWRPWGVHHVVLQPASQRVADIGVEDVAKALDRLRRNAG